MKRLLLLASCVLSLACDGRLTIADVERLESVADAGASDSQQNEADSGPPAIVRDGAPYPVILVHGLLGARRYGPVDYWWKVADRLQREGERVFVSEQEPLRTPEDRALQLAAFVDQVIAETNAAKVNLVAHSMGGLDARFMVSQLGYGDRVASLTTVATPHGGSPVADAIVGSLSFVGLERLVGDAIGGFVALVDGDEQDALDTARALTTDASRDFNAANPDDPQVAYFSVIAHTSADPLCGFKREKDCVDGTLLGSYLFIQAVSGANDGMVPRESARWGEVVADVPSDHLNEVGHPLGAVGNDWNPWDFYAGHARFLHDRGF